MDTCVLAIEFKGSYQDNFCGHVLCCIASQEINGIECCHYEFFKVNVVMLFLKWFVQ